MRQELSGQGNGLVPAADILLLVEAADMGFDGGRCYRELLGNLFVGEPGVNQPQDLLSAAGQRRGADQLWHVGPRDNIRDDRFI